MPDIILACGIIDAEVIEDEAVQTKDGCPRFRRILQPVGMYIA
jgi:hypothetical protein